MQGEFLYAPGSTDGLADFKALVGEKGPDPDKAGATFRKGSSIRAAMMITAGGKSEPLLEVAVGKADFLPSVFLESGAAAARAVGRIVVRGGIDYAGQLIPGGWLGTGFLVGPGLLLTNHHVLNSIEVAMAATFQLNYRFRIDGTADTFEEFALQPDRLFITSPVKKGLDYTFVAIDPKITDRFSFVPMDRRAYVIAPPTPGNIIQHPQGRHQEIVIQDNPVMADNGFVLHYLSDTEPGSSGSPVFDNRWRLIALHHASANNDEKIKDPWGDTPQFVNEGIKLSSIASDLEARRGPPGSPGPADRVLECFAGINSVTGFFGTLGRTSSQTAGVEALVQKYKGTEQDVDIGSWNIEWFSNRYETKLDRVASVIADFNLDVWSLVESSPKAAEALVNTLKDKFGLEYGVAHSEPDAPTSKQSTSMIWNLNTVDGSREEWDEEVKEWLAVSSQNFSDDMLEAVHGKVFDRYPGLFRFKAKDSKFDFYAVPLHLKAMDEGSLRREMASKILAAAIDRMIPKVGDSDWILLGDLNAEIASTNFAPLSRKGLVPLSAEDEQNQSFTYLKSPHKSMIDHVYITADMARRFGSDDFFIVAADKTYPAYIKEISDHRPIVTRLSLADAVPALATELPEGLSATLKELYGG